MVVRRFNSYETLVDLPSTFVFNDPGLVGEEVVRVKTKTSTRTLIRKDFSRIHYNYDEKL